MIRIYCTVLQVLGGEKHEAEIVFWNWAENIGKERKCQWQVPGRVVVPSIFAATSVLVIHVSGSFKDSHCYPIEGSKTVI